MKYSSDDLEVKINARGGSGKSANWQWNVYVKGPGGARLAHGMETGARDKAVRAGNSAIDKFASSET
jgi:hypothetical protein